MFKFSIVLLLSCIGCVVNTPFRNPEMDCKQECMNQTQCIHRHEIECRSLERCLDRCASFEDRQELHNRRR